MNEELVESTKLEAAHQSAVLKEADINARGAQTEEIVERMLRKVLGTEIDDNKDILIIKARVPLICQMIIAIEGRLSSIEDNIRWAVRIVVAAVLVALVGMVMTMLISHVSATIK